MSELLLERLSKKTTKQKMKPIEIKLDKGQVAVQVAIVKSNEEYDMELFKQKLLKRGLQAPTLFIKPAETKEEIKEEETDINIPQRVKPKKIGKYIAACIFLLVYLFLFFSDGLINYIIPTT